MKFVLLFLYSCLFSSYTYAAVQYTPSPSSARHEFTAGALLEPNLESFKSIKDLKSVGNFSLNYGFYFPSFEELLPTKYAKYTKFFKAGIQIGTQIYKDVPNTSGSNYNEGCASADKFVIHNAGLKLSIDYLEFVRPFVEVGKAYSQCMNYTNWKDINFSNSVSQATNYSSLGALFSFKILSRSSMYGLDQDYGINDFGLLLKCSQFSFEDKNPLKNCTLGVNLVF